MGDLWGPSLTTAQLREIQDRRSADDVIVLLWEIKRLHVVLRRADQLAGMLRHLSNGPQCVLEALREELSYFPLLKEEAAARAAILMHERETHLEKLRRKTGGRPPSDDWAAKLMGPPLDDCEGPD